LQACLRANVHCAVTLALREAKGLNACSINAERGDSASWAELQRSPHLRSEAAMPAQCLHPHCFLRPHLRRAPARQPSEAVVAVVAQSMLPAVLTKAVEELSMALAVGLEVGAGRLLHRSTARLRPYRRQQRTHSAYQAAIYSTWRGRPVQPRAQPLQTFE
jgi:hypothetical protein